MLASVSIILCTHRSDRYDDFLEAINSLKVQSYESLEIVDKESVRFVSKNCIRTIRWLVKESIRIYM